MRRLLNIFTNKHWLVISAVLFLAFAVNQVLISQFTMKDIPGSIEADLVRATITHPLDFNTQVKPVLEQRCIVCHGCYDAPCQLKLSSDEGLRRGANTENIYDPSRLTALQPSRLFIDEKNTKDWRERGFHPVLNESQASSPEDNLKNSVLYHLLRLKQQHPQPSSSPLSDNFTLALNRKQTCPTLDTVNEYARKNPLWGMPYAMPNLTQPEYQTLVSWLAQGAPTPNAPLSSNRVTPQIEQWERFFNGQTNKQKLVSRYLYEHLFHAHIHFSGSPSREFYRLVRSRSAQGQIIDEIATLLPFDDPGDARFYYRLKRYTPSIVVKNHIVYEFSDHRMQRYRELFLQPDYSVDKLPAYDIEHASNPFKVFADIPSESRYRFLLDESRFFIEGFIKGPVCRGQIALNVIEDKFWVMFFDPKQPVITNDSAFISQMSNVLKLPEDGGSNLDLLRIWTDYWQGQRQYMARKQEWFKTIGTHDIDHAMNFIWDGEGKNPNAGLTIFRHFDSGSVAYGLVGDRPETAWVIDYPLFERIHYLLVAGFNVFGNLGHRMSTRIYMDFLRMEGEDYFLAFLPVNRRKEIRDSWYVGQRQSIEKLFAAPQEWLKTEAVSGYRTDDPQKELYQHMKNRLADAMRETQTLNRCGQENLCNKALSKSEILRVNTAMDIIVQLQGKSLHAFPDVAFVRIKTNNPDNDLAYTLIRNKAYKNVTSLLADEHERERSDTEKDTMTVVDWLEGSYPNYFFSVPLVDVDNFSQRCANIRSHEDYERFVKQYGVSRTGSEFWSQADWFQEEFQRNQPMRAGIFDLNRYSAH